MLVLPESAPVAAPVIALISTALDPTTTAAAVPTAIIASPTSVAVPVPTTTLPAVNPSTAPAVSAPTAPSVNPPANAPTTTIGISPSAYLEAALDRIQRASFKVQRNLVDIELIKANARQRATNAANLVDTYPAIREALLGLGDGHSSFADPDAAKRLTQGTSTGFGFDRFRGGVVFPYLGSPAAAAGMRDLDRIVAVNGRSTEGPTAAESALDTLQISVVHRGEGAPVELNMTRGVYDSARLPQFASIGHIAYLDLPGTRGTGAKTQAFIQAGIVATQSANQVDSCGWVLDVRRNSGGFPYPMFAAIAPLVGEGLFLSQARTDRTDPWVLLGGRVYVSGVAVTDTGNVTLLRQPAPPIAVLTSTSTASAGEAAVLAMIGRPDTRIFGEPTVGVTSTNVAYTLGDGSLLQVTTSYDVDRADVLHDGRIAPDQALTIDWSTLGTDTDPTLNAAIAWLNEQPACRTVSAP